MATVHVDLIGDISCKEKNGRPVEIRRLYFVTDFALGTGSGNGTGSVANAADAFDDILGLVALPQPGASITVQSVKLYVKGRDCKIVDGGNCEVIITYKARGIMGWVSGDIAWSGASSMNQIETNVDENDEHLSVQYKSFKAQGGPMTVLIPQAELVGTTLESTSDPQAIEKAWTGYVNHDVWKGGEARTWLCMGVSWEPSEATGQYAMTYRFQYNSDKWDPSIRWTDPADGKWPDDLVPGVGEKTITWYPEKDFDTVGDGTGTGSGA